MNYKHNIYFVCRGTSTNDILNSVNKLFNEKKKSLSSSFWGVPNKNDKSNKLTKINLDDFSPLEEIGIQEMYMCKANENIIKHTDPKIEPLQIYTSMELSSIESGLILSNGKQIQMTVTPLPYMSNNTNVNNKNLRQFMELFGQTRGLLTNVQNYWKTKKTNSFLNIYSKTTLNWINILNNTNYLNSFNYDKFKVLFKDIFLENYKLKNPNGYKFPVAIIVVDVDFIEKLLKNISRKNSKFFEIERGSVWDIQISINFTFDSAGRIIKKDIKYENFEKVYPRETNYTPLKFVNKTTFTYDFNRQNYTLFNAKNIIPLEFIKRMNFIRLSTDKILALKKAIEITDKKVDEKDNNKKLIDFNKPSTFSFDD